MWVRTWRMRTLSTTRTIVPFSILLLILSGLTACRCDSDHLPTTAATATTVTVDDPLVTLYRLDGDAGRQPDGENTFHDWIILNTRIITDPDTQQNKILIPLQAGIDDPDARQRRCFIPRHGIRHLTKDGQTLDYVICFQCGSYHLYRNGERATGGTIGPVDFLRSFPRTNKQTR